VSDVPEPFVELGLRLGRHIAGLVDAYFGPPELAQRVAPQALVAEGTATLAPELALGD
jgi:hypothetical protein